ncbi:hypothetical protein HY522_10355 [bacterium]|nr:hypothetical protein [bacterium]
MTRALRTIRRLFSRILLAAAIFSAGTLCAVAGDEAVFDEISALIREGKSEEAKEKIGEAGGPAKKKGDYYKLYRLSILATEIGLKDTVTTDAILFFSTAKKHSALMPRQRRLAETPRFEQIRNEVSQLTCASFFEQLAMTDRGATEYPVILVDQFFSWAKDIIDDRTLLAGTVAKARVQLARGEADEALKSLRETRDLVRDMLQKRPDLVQRDTYVGFGIEQYQPTRVRAHLFAAEPEDARSALADLHAALDQIPGGAPRKAYYADWYDTHAPWMAEQAKLRGKFEPLVKTTADALVKADIKFLKSRMTPASPQFPMLEEFFRKQQYKKWTWRIVQIAAESPEKPGSRVWVKLWVVSELEFRHGDDNTSVDFNGDEATVTKTERVTTYNNAGMQTAVFQFDGAEWKLDKI